MQVSAADAAIFPDGDAPERVAPDIWRIPLPLPLALRSVNVYVIDGGPGNRTLVDAGLGLPTDFAALSAGLEMAGVALGDIDVLILTHAHPDHVGHSGTIQAATGGPVCILDGEDYQLLHVWTSTERDMMAEVDAMFAANGLPDHLRTGAAEGSRMLRSLLKLPPVETLHLLHDGETLHLGAHDYRIIWTPGHSDYHMCLLRDDGVFLAGDHVLPTITPNIGLYPGGRPNPLQDYFASLARVAPLEATIVLPGHGHPFADLAGRAAALRQHHIERGDEAERILADGPTDAATVAGKLFGSRLRTPDDWRFAMAETLAHLEFLRLEGRIERDESGEIIRYQLATATVTKSQPSRQRKQAARHEAGPGQAG